MMPQPEIQRFQFAGREFSQMVQTPAGGSTGGDSLTVGGALFVIALMVEGQQTSSRARGDMAVERRSS